MVKIRLARAGRKKIPSYKLVVMDSRAPRNGRAIDILGYYNPLTDPETVAVDAEKASRWLRQGARPTPAAGRLLAKLTAPDNPAPLRETR